MKIIDAFLAVNEFDMIEARIAEMGTSGYEIEHLAFESRYTHQGDPKPYYLRELDLSSFKPGRLTTWSDTKPYERTDQYAIERAQRDSLLGIIEKVYAPAEDDLVFVTDVDEIVRGSAISRVLAATVLDRRPVALDLRMHRYSSKWVEAERWDHNAFAARWRDLVDGPSFSDLRNRPYGEGALSVVPNAGWHLSYWGDADRFHQKLEMFLHDELKYLHPQVDELIENGINVHGGQMLPWDGSDMPKGII